MNSWKLITCAVFAALLSFNAYAQEGYYHIDGYLSKSISKGAVYLVISGTGGEIEVRKSDVKAGHYMFSGSVTQPQNVTLVLSKVPVSNLDWNDAKEKFGFWLDNERIKILSLTSFSNSEIKSSKINRDARELQLAAEPGSAMYEKANKMATSTPDSIKSQTTFIRQYEIVEDSAASLSKQELISFIKNHTDSFLSLRALKSIAGSMPSYDILYPLYIKLSSNIKSLPDGLKLSEFLNQLHAVANNSLAPEFTLTDTASNSISLRDLKGKYVLIDFWASMCLPCRRAIKDMIGTYDKFHSKGFEILGVSQDTNSDFWKAAIKADGENWLQVIDNKGDVGKTYVVEGIPQNYLLDKNGVIIDSNLSPDRLDQVLNQLLNK